MPLQFFDTATNPEGKGHEIQAAGFDGVMLYARPDRASAQVIQDFRGIGLKVGWAWEKGNPTESSYFNATRGTTDAALFAQYASDLGISPGECIFAAVDYDASQDDIDGVITSYFVAFHSAVKAAGFYVGVYGSGSTCSSLANAGLVHYTWLAQSTGWTGYEAWKGSADIIQGIEPGGVICGLGADPDTVVNEAFL